MDLSYLILCPDKDVSGLKATIRCLQTYCPQRTYLPVLGGHCDASDVDAFRSINGDACKAGKTLTSMVNLGFKKLKHEWIVILFSGAQISRQLERRIHQYATDEHDILFPVVNKQWGFVEGSFNGVVINLNFFKKVGDFPEIEKSDSNDFELSKLLWAQDALKTKGQFKAIVGLGVW